MFLLLRLIILIFANLLPLTSSTKEKFLHISPYLEPPGLPPREYSLITTATGDASEILSTPSSSAGDKSTLQSSIEFGATPAWGPIQVRLKSINKNFATSLMFEIMDEQYPRTSILQVYASVSRKGELKIVEILSFINGIEPIFKWHTFIGPHPSTLIGSKEISLNNVHFHDWLNGIVTTGSKMVQPVLGEALKPYHCAKTLETQPIPIVHAPDEPFINGAGGQENLDLHIFLANSRGKRKLQNEGQQLVKLSVDHPNALIIILDFDGSLDLSGLNQYGFYVIGCYLHQNNRYEYEAENKMVKQVKKLVLDRVETWLIEEANNRKLLAKKKKKKSRFRHRFRF